MFFATIHHYVSFLPSWFFHRAEMGTPELSVQAAHGCVEKEYARTLARNVIQEVFLGASEVFGCFSVRRSSDGEGYKVTLLFVFAGRWSSLTR